MKNKDNTKPKLYGELSWLWPALSPPEHYVEEANVFTEAARNHALIEVGTLLDLGCGGGHNDMTLKRSFRVTGVDLSEDMLAMAKRLNPEVEYLPGDMKAVRLGRRFDAVAVFDSIDYMLDEADLHAAFATAWEHLNPGGVFLTYLEETKERFEDGRTHIIERSTDGFDLVYVEHTCDPDPDDTTYESTMVYLIRRGGKLEAHVDRNELGIFRVRDAARLLRSVGFRVKVLEFKIGGEEGSPMLVGVKPLRAGGPTSTSRGSRIPRAARRTPRFA